MAIDTRITQIPAEAWDSEPSTVRHTQEAVEAFDGESSEVRVTQQPAEVYNGEPSEIRVTQIIVEIWKFNRNDPPPLLGSGIYKIDPAAHKRNDTIYGQDFSEVDVKIPDPFVTTGYIGD